MNEYASNPKDFCLLLQTLRAADVNARPIITQFFGRNVAAFIQSVTVEQEEHPTRHGYLVGIGVHLALPTKLYNGMMKSVDSPRSVHVCGDLTKPRNTTAFTVGSYMKDTELADDRVAFFVTAMACFRLGPKNPDLDRAISEILK